MHEQSGAVAPGPARWCCERLTLHLIRYLRDLGLEMAIISRLWVIVFG